MTDQAVIPAGRRLLLVHAHPDDETIGTGATMARYAAEGAEVTLLTCTLGENGEILVPQLAQLGWDQGDQLGGYRMGELQAALAGLGVTRQHFLGGAGRFRDSGMIGTPGNEGRRAFWRAAGDPTLFQEAVRHAVGIIRAARPQVVITYDPNGGYGHPDHVMAHRVTTAAVAAAADPSYVAAPGTRWDVQKFYWTATPRSVLREDTDALRHADTTFAAARFPHDFPYAVDDAEVTTAIDAGDFVEAKKAAMTAHATQITVRGAFFALSNNLGLRVRGTEHYRLVRGEVAGRLDGDGRETDLFAGVA